MFAAERAHGCRILEYERGGLRFVVLENRSLRVTVIPDKGSDIVEFRFKPLDLDVLWRSPIGLRDPRTTLPSSAGTGPMLDLYEGGWQEILPSGGPPSAHAGAEWGQHGETTTLPWEYRIAVDEEEHAAVEFRARLLRYPLVVEKTLRLRREHPVLTIEEALTNEADEPVELMWGHHPTVGAPFLSERCRFHVPGGTTRVPEERTFERQRCAPGATGRWPSVAAVGGGELDLSSMPPAAARTAELLYVTELPEGWYAIVNEELGAGFGLSFDVGVFPHLWYWQVARGAFGYPWFGRTYSMALEPWTSWPGDGLAAAVRRGTALTLEAGERLETELHASAWVGGGAVRCVTADGVRLAEGVT